MPANTLKELCKFLLVVRHTQKDELLGTSVKLEAEEPPPRKTFKNCEINRMSPLMLLDTPLGREFFNAGKVDSHPIGVAAASSSGANPTFGQDTQNTGGQPSQATAAPPNQATKENENAQNNCSR